jgi:hypothetical protein
VTRILGDAGLSIWSGYLGEEYLVELKPWTNEARYVLEARDEAIIGTLLDAIKMPMIRAEIVVEPASDEEADIQLAQFVDANLRGMHKQSLRKWLTDMIEAIEFGFSLGEIVLEKRTDGRLWIRNIMPRGQETLRRWAAEDPAHPDEFSHFIQGMYRGSAPRREVAIPLNKCLHVTWRGRKGNPQGKSLLRSLYSPYKFLKNFRVIEGIGVERDIGGTPIIKLPGGQNSLSDAEKTELKKNAEGLRNDEALYIMVPEGMDIEAYNSGGKSTNVREIIKDYETQILMRMFAQFLKLGMDNVGTQALVVGSQDFFTMAIESIQDELIEQVNEQLVPYLMRFNTFPGTTGLPKVTWMKPGAMDVANIVEMFTKGAQSKIFTPTREDEVLLRDEAGLPELPEGKGEGDRDVTAAVNDVFGGLGMGQMTPRQLGAFVDEIRAYDEARRTYDHPAGGDLRGITGGYEKFTNAYQKELVGVYDKWAAETSRLMSLPGKGLTEANATLNTRLNVLSADMKLLARARIGEATQMGMGTTLGKRAHDPEVQRTIAALLKEAELNIDEGVIPGVREKFGKEAGAAQKLKGAEKKNAFEDLFSGRRNSVARQAGGAQVAIFETQKSAGIVENRERKRLGIAPIATRWVLDKSAEHCEDDSHRATYGCPALAREYADGWESMPTVPAGAVSCLGNCRCYIEADLDGTGVWSRIT